MAELSQTLDTRIILKNGTLSEWTSSTLKLLEGEVALAKVNVPQPDGTVAPTFVAKIGVEGKTFSECPMLFAPASDVYAWAKLENPTVEQLPDNIKKAITDLQSAIRAGGSVTQQIEAAINTLDGTTTGDGNFVKAVTQTDGKISVTKGKIEVTDVEGLNARLNGIDDAISDITNPTTGSLAVLSGKIATEEGARSEADAALSDRIANIEGVIGGVTGAMHFKGVIDTDPTKITTGYDAGDVVIYNNKEYVFNTTVNGATANGFVELGDVTEVDQRLTTVEKNKVEKTTYDQKVQDLEGALAQKAPQSELTNLTGRVEIAEGEIDDLQEAINTPVTGLAAKVDKNAQDIADEKGAREEVGERVSSIETLLTGTLILNCGGPSAPAAT